MNMKVKEAESAYAHAQRQFAYAEDLLQEATTRRWERYAELCAVKYGLVEGAVIILDPTYHRPGPKEALFDSIAMQGSPIGLDVKPYLMVRRKAKNGWAKVPERCYGDWKVKT